MRDDGAMDNALFELVERLHDTLAIIARDRQKPCVAISACK